MESHTSISKPEKQLLHEIDNFEININKVTETTNGNNLDIDACLCKQKEQVEKILMIANNKAHRNFESMQVQIKNLTGKAQSIVNEANNIERNMNKIIGYCIRQNNLSWQKQKLLDCLFQEANEVNGIVDSLYEENKVIQNDVKIALSNTNRNQNNLLEWLSKIQNEFFHCVSESILSEAEESPPIEDETNISEMPESSGEVKKEDRILSDEDLGNQRILDGIKRLEALIDQLKNLYQREDIQNSKPALTSTENKFREDTNKMNDDEKDKRYLLYISF